MSTASTPSLTYPPSRTLLHTLICLSVIGGLPAMVGGGGGGFGGGGFGGGGGGGRAGADGSAPVLYAPAWATAKDAFSPADGRVPNGVVLVFTTQPDVSGLYTDKLLASDALKRLRHVRLERGIGDHDRLAAEYGVVAYPTMVFCDGYGNALSVLRRPSRQSVAKAYQGFDDAKMGFMHGIATSLADATRQIDAGGDRAAAAATLRRIAAMKGMAEAATARTLLDRISQDAKMDK